MPGPASDYPIDDKARELIAEAQFIDYTQWSAEFELMDASHRFLEQFSRNPFASAKMKEHNSQPDDTNATAANSGGPAVGAKSPNPFAVPIAVHEGADIAIAASASASVTAPSDVENSTANAETVAASGDTSSVEIIITKKAAFKFNPCAKEFVPDPSLVVTPFGVLPKDKALPPHQRAAVEPFDQQMSEGYRVYHNLLENKLYREDEGKTSPWG